MLIVPCPADEIETSQPYFHVELRDPWSGPRAYAEDYYSGGDVPMDPDSHHDANQIGLYDDDSTLEAPSDASHPQQSNGFDEHDTPGAHVIIDHETERTPDLTISWCSFGLKRKYINVSLFPASPSQSLDPLWFSNSPKSQEENSNLSPTCHRPTNDDVCQPKDDLGMSSSGARVAMAAAPSNFDPILHPIEFVHSHMVEDGPAELFMEPGTELVQLPDQPDTLAKDGEIPTSPETRLGEPPAADPIPENTVGHAQGYTHDEGMTESSGTLNAAVVALDDYDSSDELAELIEDPTPSKEEHMESDEQPDAQHTPYVAHAPNVITRDDASSPEESSNVHEKHVPTLVTDMDIEPVKDLPNDMVRYEDVEEGPSVDLSGQRQSADVTESLDIFESSGGDHSTEETNSKRVDLSDAYQAVIVGDEPCDIPMQDVEHGTTLEDECSRSLDQQSPYPSIDILRPQGTPEKHGEDSIVTVEISPRPLNEVTSPDVADINEGPPDHASEAEGALVLVGGLLPSQSAGVHTSTNGQEYEDINIQRPSSQSPPQYSSNESDVEDVWARYTSRRAKVLSPAREYLELDHQAELSPPTVTYDSWDAPHKYANGLISAGDGPFLLGGDSITHFVRDAIPAVFALLEVPKSSSHVQENVDVDVEVPFGHTTDVHGYIIGSERSNPVLDYLYDDLQSEPIEEVEQGEIGQIFGA